jgi:hypothetical protein
MSNPQAAAAPLEVAGKSFLMSPLSDKDVGEINKRLQASILKIARASIDEDCTEEDRRLIMDIALDRALKTDWLKDADVMNDPQNIIQIFWQGVAKNNPGMTRDEFGVLLLQNAPESLETTWDVFELQNPLVSGKNSQAEERNPPPEKESL